jgi:hypothetical protein
MAALLHALSGNVDTRLLESFRIRRFKHALSKHESLLSGADPYAKNQNGE